MISTPLATEPTARPSLDDLRLAAVAKKQATRARVVPIEHIRLLGRVGLLKGHAVHADYAMVEGAEYRIYIDKYDRLPERLQSAVVIAVGDKFRITDLVEKGTYAKLDAIQKAQAAKEAKTRPVALLERNPALSIAGLDVRRIRGVRALIAYCERSIELSVNKVNGRLIPRARQGRIVNPMLDALRDAERLIVGIKTGHPVLCEMGHRGTPPEAFDMVAFETPACEQHAKGELS